MESTTEKGVRMAALSLRICQVIIFDISEKVSIDTDFFPLTFETDGFFHWQIKITNPSIDFWKRKVLTVWPLVSIDTQELEVWQHLPLTTKHYHVVNRFPLTHKDFHIGSKLPLTSANRQFFHKPPLTHKQRHKRQNLPLTRRKGIGQQRSQPFPWKEWPMSGRCVAGKKYRHGRHGPKARRHKPNSARNSVYHLWEISV